MKQHNFSRYHDIFNVIANVICKPRSVKVCACKTSRFLPAMAVCASITFNPGLAHAEDQKALAIRNSTHLLGFVDGVIPEALPNVLGAIESGKIQRIVPSYPVWIIDSSTGNLLYYQGQKGFAGQAASRLIDDQGFRFGLRAVENARKSKSSWVSLSLGGQAYSAYCATRAPFVVCSLIQ